MDRKEARDIIHDIIAEGFPVGDRIFSMDEEEEAALRVAIEALQERPKGRWDRKTRFLGDCSECGVRATISCNFCPNCGADMRECEQE